MIKAARRQLERLPGSDRSHLLMERSFEGDNSIAAMGAPADEALFEQGKRAAIPDGCLLHYFSS
jgi:hypothetical protein